MSSSSSLATVAARLRSPGFRTRLTIRWTLVFSCVLATASVAIYVGIRASSYADLDRHLRTLAGTEMASAFDQPVSPHVHDLSMAALTGGAFTEKIVQVFDEEGRVVVASRGQSPSTPIVSPDLLAAGRQGSGPLTTVSVNGVPVRVVVLRETFRGETYAFAVGVVITDFLASLQRVQWLLLAVWLISTGATAAVGFALASTALRPVRRITERALHIADSDLRARLEPPPADDEIGAMTRSVNVLLTRLQSALDANRRFAADAAHELRSPVTAMAGEIDVALRRERTQSEYQDTLQLVRQRLTSLSSLINDLILLVRAQEGRESIVSREVMLDVLVSSSIARAEAVGQTRHVHIQTQNLSGVTVYGESNLLARVFDNVLENAVRYNREGGTVTVTAALEEASTGQWQPEQVIIRVTDTGTGIPLADRERVFTRFYRLDESRTRHTGGAGLGLAIAREVLELFHGIIVIEASSPQGTTVAIRMPGGKSEDRRQKTGDRRQEDTAVRGATCDVRDAVQRSRSG